MTPFCLTTQLPNLGEINSGARLYGDGKDYTRILSDLRKGDSFLLRKEIVDMMFEPQSAKSSNALNVLYTSSKMTWSPLAGGSPDDVGPDEGLDGFLIEDDVKKDHCEKPEGTLDWSSARAMLLRDHRERGLAMVFTAHPLPHADKKSAAVGRALESAV
jgi:hypothetical protein